MSAGVGLELQIRLPRPFQSGQQNFKYIKWFLLSIISTAGQNYSLHAFHCTWRTSGRGGTAGGIEEGKTAGSRAREGKGSKWTTEGGRKHEIAKGRRQGKEGTKR
jgi:hypothetical protein